MVVLTDLTGEKGTYMKPYMLIYRTREEQHVCFYNTEKGAEACYWDSVEDEFVLEVQLYEFDDVFHQYFCKRSWADCV